MERKNFAEILKNMGKTTRYIIVAGIVVLLIAILLLVVFSPEGGTTFSAESSLKEVFEISDLSTAEFIYNSVVEVKNDKDTMYHTSYKGTVKVGVNFEKIKILEAKDKITIIIPSIELQSVVVDTELDYIFMKDKYNDERVYAEAYNACINDLTNKAMTNQTLLATARESAVDTVRALLRPFESQLAEGQVFEVVFDDEIQEEEVQ